MINLICACGKHPPNLETKTMTDKTTNDQKSIQKLRELTKLQCSDGNWNYNNYMHGMANGMIFALSLFDGVEPIFLDAPPEWLEATEMNDD